MQSIKWIFQLYIVYNIWLFDKLRLFRFQIRTLVQLFLYKHQYAEIAEDIDHFFVVNV